MDLRESGLPGVPWQRSQMGGVESSVGVRYSWLGQL